MKGKHLLLVAACTCLAGNANAQAPGWLWAKGMGGTYGDAVLALGTDVFGNVYSTGEFSMTVDFDPGTGTHNITAINSDIFISKLDSLGNFVWAKAVGGNGADAGRCIKLDANGNIFIAGSFTNTVDFDPGPGVFSFNVGTRNALFLLKLDPGGNFVWAKATGPWGSSFPQSMALDASGNIYITGYFSNTIDFDPGPGIFNLSAVGGEDIFISKFDSSGNFVWAKAIGGTGFDYGFSIALDLAGSGDVYSTGHFASTTDFNPDSTGTFNLTASGNADIYISKMNSSGHFVWAKRIGGISVDHGKSIALDGSGHVYTTGDFTGSADFDPGAATFLLNSATASDPDIFLCRFDSSGNFIWAKRMGGTGYDSGRSVALDPSGSQGIYCAGFFASTADFDPGAGVFNLTAASSDYFVSKLDSAGNFAWAKAVGGTGYDARSTLVVGPTGNVFLAGEFVSPAIAFGSTTLTNTDSTGNSGDIFISRLAYSPTGNTEIENSENIILLFPNPARNQLTIAFRRTIHNAEVTITDMAGHLLYKTTATQTIDVNTNDFAGGMYIVQIQTAGAFETKKFIVTK